VQQLREATADLQLQFENGANIGSERGGASSSVVERADAAEQRAFQIGMTDHDVQSRRRELRLAHSPIGIDGEDGGDIEDASRSSGESVGAEGDDAQVAR